MYIKVLNFNLGGGARLSLSCPHCGHQGTFEPLQNITDVNVGHLWLGQRKCPNPQCYGHLFCIYEGNGNVLRSYPALRIDFDPKNIPERIAKTLVEALVCYAEQCFVASAIMIRRTLEELCEDKKAQGDTLKERVQSLRSAVVLPNELFVAMDELRLLGNDAAHIEAKTYNSIGREEIEAGISLTKEILKAVYQLDDLVKKLQALKNQ